jgi:hypothetical protein
MPQFHVICLRTKQPINHPASGHVWVFTNGNAAARVARSSTDINGEKYQPRAVKEADGGTWRDRERLRLEDGTYITIRCWASQSWWQEANKFSPVNDHFAHVSRNFPGKVAFTESAEKGAADRQTVIKPGAYLARYFKEWLTPNRIKAMANKFTVCFKTTEVRFARTADEIEWVYTRGPASCMAHPPAHYVSPIHPTRIYAGGDLAVAYIMRDEDSEIITARALVWPKKKIYGRIYGERARLDAALQQLGFHDDYNANNCETFTGAHMKRVRHEGALVVPYIDGLNCATDTGKMLLMGYVEGAGYKIDAERTDGMSKETGMQVCYCCDQNFRMDDMIYIADGEYVCTICANDYTWLCECCGRHYYDRDAQVEVNISPNRQGYFCTSCSRHQVFECERSGQYYLSGAFLPINVAMIDGAEQRWVESEVVEHGYFCGLCDRHYERGADCGECAARAEIHERLPQG